MDKYISKMINYWPCKIAWILHLQVQTLTRHRKATMNAQLGCPIIIGCISKGQCQSILRTSLHRVRLIEQVDMSHVKVPSETLFRFWGLLGAFESEFLIFASNRCGVKVIFPLSFSYLLVVEVQMRYDPERYVCKPKQACYCFTKDHEKKSAEAFMTGSESPVL